MLVVLERTWVNTVARNICQVVMNIGKGKFIDDRTALLKRICVRYSRKLGECSDWAVHVSTEGKYHCAADRHPEYDIKY